MTPRLEACYFGADPSGQWGRLAHVLRVTADEQCPGWDVRVQHIKPRRHRSALFLQSNVANTQKLEEWCRLVAEAEDGQAMLLIDTDTAILRPLDDIWLRPFDLAYTTKPGARFPFNGGVLFVRVSSSVRAVFTAWWAENLRMLGDAAYHRPFRRVFGGVNQAAFGALLRRNALAGLQVLELPCSEWNCEDASWHQFDPASTRILHVKDGVVDGNLRKTIFGAERGPVHVQQLARLWQDLEAKSVTTSRRTA